MDDEKLYLSNNIKRLMQIREIPSLTQLADRCAGEITTRTLSGLVNYHEDNNPSLEKLQILARVFRVKVWMLLIEDFPFSVAISTKPPKRITSDGYTLLRVFESCTNDQVRYALLEATKQAIKPLDERASNQIADAQAHYHKNNGRA